MLVRYPPSEIQAEPLKYVYADLFRIYRLVAFNCVSSFRQDAPWNDAQNVPLNAAKVSGRMMLRMAVRLLPKLMVGILCKMFPRRRDFGKQDRRLYKLRPRILMHKREGLVEDEECLCKFTLS